ITVNNASTYVRNGSINPGLGSTFNGILIVGPQIYNNSVSSRPALDLRTVNNGNITMQDSIFVTTANNTSGEIFFTTSNSGSLNLLKGLSTTSNLTISGVTSINLGNNVAGVGANNITLGVAGSNGLTINNPLNLIGNVTMALAATKPLSINSTINGGNDLRISAQGGNISITGDVGGVTPLRNIILDSSAANLTFSGTTIRAGGLSTNNNFVSGNIDLSIPTTQVFNGVTTLILQASGNILLNAMNLSGTANLQIDNNNTGILELRGSITNVNSQFLQQRATGGTAGASGAVAGVKIGTSSGVGAVSIAGTNTGGTSIQFQGSEIGRVTKILSLVTGGSGYSQGDLLTISGVSAPGTVGATVTVQSVDGSGGITSLSTVNNPLDNFGYNITTLTGISLVGGTGSGAVVNAYGVSDTFVDLLSSTSVSTLSGGNITFNGRVESTNAKSFTVSSVSGNLTFKDDVGLADGGRASFPLASFTASTGGIGRVIFSDESNGVGTSGNITVTGNSTISNSSLFTAGPGNISFSGDLSGTTVGASDLTFRNTGSISVGSLGQGTNGILQDVLIDGNATSFATSVASGSNGGILATSFKTGSNIVVQGAITVVGQQTYGNVAGTNDVSLVATGNIVMNSQDITSVGNLSLTSSGGNISLRAVTGTGNAIFSHNVGNLNLEGNLFARSFSEAASAAAVNIGSVGGTTVTLNISTGDVAFNSGVVLINDAIITTASNSNVSFQRTLKGGATNSLRNLNLNNAGNVAFVGSVGGSGSVVGTAERIGNITIGSSSLFGLSASGTDFKAASLVTTNPVLGNVSLTSTILDLTGSAGLNLATSHDGHVVSLAKNTGGAGYSVGDILNVGTTGFTTVATVQVLAVTGGSIDSFKILTAGSGYTNGGTYFLTGGTSGAQVTVTSNVSSNIALGVTNLNSTGGLTLNSSTNTTLDAVTLTGNITNAAGITQNGTVDVTLGSTSAITISTSASTGAIFGGNLVVAQNTQMNVGGGITITGTINSVDSNNIRSLGLQSTIGTIGINSEIGATNALLSFTANAGANGTVTIQDLSDTSVSVLTQSGVSITGNLNLVETDTTLDGGTAGNVALAGNVSGFASSDLTLKTNGGAISVTGATGIGTSAVRMGEIVIDGTPASLQITGNVYADSLSTVNNLAAAITVSGSQFITNNVKLYSNNGPISLG
ncbi:MAG: hypothetical protein EBQ87_01725, partial [Planctomycetes bacterium]|nr:hypothetical protein [Planctomycetota bacterium]